MKLCYVDGGSPWYGAFFTSAELRDTWGDDWDDRPFEHNAGVPYTFDENAAKRGREPWEIEEILFQPGQYEFVGDLHSYFDVSSPFSVFDINLGGFPWLWSKEFPPIYPGTGPEEFREKIKAAGGSIYEGEEDGDAPSLGGPNDG